VDFLREWKGMVVVVVVVAVVEVVVVVVVVVVDRWGEGILLQAVAVLRLLE
jgi:hypothetical protein